MQTFLSVFFVPEHIKKTVRKIKKQLFEEEALLSAYALPLFYSLNFHTTFFNWQEIDFPLDFKIKSIQITGPEIKNGCLILKTQPQFYNFPPGHQISKKTHPGLPPEGCIWLTFQEKLDKLEKAAANIQLNHDLHWEKSDLGLYKLVPVNNIFSPFYGLLWEELWRITGKNGFIFPRPRR